MRLLPALLLTLISPVAAAEVEQSVTEAESKRIAVIERVKDCVLAVFPPTGQGGGSGVVISPDGYALSNYHVVLPCGPAMKCGMADGQIYDAVVVGIDPGGDVALIKLFGRDDFPYAELGDSDLIRPGQTVFALGNPFLLAANLQPTVTSGIVSGVHRYQFPAGTLLEYADCLQIDAAINPGNSGGPLFDETGKLIGINGRASFEKRGRVNVGAAYAISINQIKNFLGSLRAGLIADHATLGARVAADADGRVVVVDILENSDAFRRGLRYDDEIVSFAGRSITTANGFKNALGILPKGWRVPLSFRRNGKRYDVLVRLSGVHSQEELIEKALGRPPTDPMPIPNPKPDDAPRPADGKPKPRPAMRPKSPAEAPLLKIVADHYQQRRGYANYYFNVMHQQRVWKAWTENAIFAQSTGKWMLAGHRLPQPSNTEKDPGGEGGKFCIHIGPAEASLSLPTTEINWTAGDNIGQSPLPAGSGGLLPALFLWRRLAVEGLLKFGEVYYDGTAPLPGLMGQYDVLVGLHKGVECRFYFDPADGKLLAVEMFASDDADPCEVYFHDYRHSDGRWWPSRIEVRHGDVKFADFAVEQFSIER